MKQEVNDEFIKILHQNYQDHIQKGKIMIDELTPKCLTSLI